ncbi:hypothetical protein [Nonomuraea sp. NPDC001699]
MRASYLPSLTLDEYLRLVATVHPQVHAVLDFDRPGAARALGVLVATSSEFDSDRGGRGDSYRRAQQDALVRWTGIRALLGLLTPDPADGPPLLLDVLGGDGTVARAAAGRLGSLDAKPLIITGDLSGQMVDRAAGSCCTTSTTPAPWRGSSRGSCIRTRRAGTPTGTSPGPAWPPCSRTRTCPYGCSTCTTR